MDDKKLGKILAITQAGMIEAKGRREYNMAIHKYWGALVLRALVVICLASTASTITSVVTEKGPLAYVLIRSGHLINDNNFDRLVDLVEGCR